MTRTSESPRDEWPSVEIIILNWESYENTAECLESLESLEYPDARVTVVDNGSTDESGERLATEFEWCEFVFNETNLGFAGGNNVGIERARERGVDYVLLLNNDTVVTDGFLRPLVETAEERDRVAAVGGVNRYYHTNGIHNAGVRFPLALGGKTMLWNTPKGDDPYQTDYVPSCLVLLSSEFIERHDVLCDDYFVGMEDVDLAWQARTNGWKVLINPESVIYHKTGMTSSSSPFVVYQTVRNRLQFAANRLSVPERLVFTTSHLLQLFGELLLWTLKGDDDRFRAAKLALLDHVSSRKLRSYSQF
jgi:GT2 family glycosyltransferase